MSCSKGCLGRLLRLLAGWLYSRFVAQCDDRPAPAAPAAAAAAAAAHGPLWVVMPCCDAGRRKCTGEPHDMSYQPDTVTPSHKWPTIPPPFATPDAPQMWPSPSTPSLWK